MAVFLTLVCYGLAGYLWWQRRTPLFVFTLLSGHLAALASPLWSLVYGIDYAADLAPMLRVSGVVLLKPVVVASAWHYALPALLVFFLYISRWWFSGYLTGLLTYTAFLVYYLLFELFGLSLNVWNYAGVGALPLGIAPALLSALLVSLVSLGLLYVLLLVFRYPWLSMLLVLVPATLGLALVVHGLIGAPLWISLLFDAERWAVTIGMLCTLGMIAWAVHIVSWGMARVDREIVV